VGRQADAFEFHRAEVGGHADTIAVAHFDDSEGTVAAARLLVFFEQGVRETLSQRAARGDDAAQLVVGLGDVGLELGLESLNVGGDGLSFFLHLLLRGACGFDALLGVHLVVFELGQATIHLGDLVFHGGNVAQGHLVVVDAALLALAALAHLGDLVLDAGHLAGGVRDEGTLSDGGALQVGDAARELAHGRVRGVGVALVAQRRFLLVKLLELEKVELVGVRRFHASSPWVTR